MASIFQEILDLVWPVFLDQVLKQLSQVEMISALGFFAISIFLVNWIVRNWLARRDYEPGNLFSEVINLLAGAIAFIVPVVFLYWYLEKKFPVMTELLEKVIELTGVEEKLRIWTLIIFAAIVLVAVERFVIHVASFLLQKALEIVPILGSILAEIVKIFEYSLYSVTIVMLPFNTMILAQSVGEWDLKDSKPLLQSGLIYPMPVGTSPEVWDAIQEGVGRANENGVSCDPYHILALKESETGVHLCDATMKDDRCISSANCQGMMQFAQGTFDIYSNRHGVNGDLWEPSVSVEVACYAIQPDGINLSLEMDEEEYVSSFSLINGVNLVWNGGIEGAAQARRVYRRAKELHLKYDSQVEEVHQSEDSFVSIPGEGWLWPTLDNRSFIFLGYGDKIGDVIHNGIDIDIVDAGSFIPFEVVAIADGTAFYWDGGSCNWGVINLTLASGEVIQYVHLSRDSQKISIPMDGTSVQVKRGQPLGWVHDGGTSCSGGPHLHLMFEGGGYIGEEMFVRP